MKPCDFCGLMTAEGKKITPQAQIMLLAPDRPAYVDRGIWLACLDCAQLIASGEWKSLLGRANRLNSSMIKAEREHKLPALNDFIAKVWGGVLGVPEEAFRATIDSPSRPD